MSAKKTDSASSAPQKLELVPDKLPQKPNGHVLFAFRCKDPAVLNKAHILFHSYADADLASVPKPPFLGRNGRQVAHIKGRDERIAASYYSEPDAPDICYLILKKVNERGKSLGSDIYPGNVQQAQKECLRLLLEKKLITFATKVTAIKSNREKMKASWEAYERAPKEVKQGSADGTKAWKKEIQPAEENQDPDDGATLLSSSIIHLFPRHKDGEPGR